MKFRPRFSLKWLMLFVAAVGIFCAYHVNWIHQRHEFVKEVSDRYDQAVRKHQARGGGSLLSHRTSSFNLVWLFGETMQKSVELVKPNQKELERAIALFPEADIYYDIFFDTNDAQP
jgi:hypothetical protein